MQHEKKMQSVNVVFGSKEEPIIVVFLNRICFSDYSLNWFVTPAYLHNSFEGDL